MFKAKLISSVITAIFLMSFSNSYSQLQNINSTYSKANQLNNINHCNEVIFKLHSSKPTEFNNTTRIEFEIGEEAKVNLTVSDYKGNVVETLIDELIDAGVYNVNFKTDHIITAGEYTYKLEVKGVSGIKNVFAVK